MATILCPRSSCLRLATHSARSLAVQAPVKASLTGIGANQLRCKSSTHEPIRPSSQLYAAARIRNACFATPTASARHASTSQTPSPISETPAQETVVTEKPTQQAAAPGLPPQELLTWDRFFDLRRKRRYVSTGASVFTALGSVGVFAPIISSQDIDTWGAQISGMDPFIVLGFTTFGAAVLGWLIGPTFGNAGFGYWAAGKGWKRAITEKEKSFYARIKRYRADPSASSPQNPIPDYYGEKIKSVKDYRRWLKDQRAFNRKKSRALL